MEQYPRTYVAFEGQKFTMRGLYETDIMFRRWQRTHTFYELGLLKQIRSYRRHGCYIDVGANLGNHSVFFTNFCPATALIAIEAHPLIYKPLLHNLAVNVPSDVAYFTENRAVLDGNTKAVDVGNIDPANVGSTRVFNNPEGNIPTISIDSITRHRTDIAVIKMDIEGCERRALMGTLDTIQRCRPLVAMEASTADELRQLTTVMKSFKYKVVFKTDKKPASYLWVPK